MLIQVSAMADSSNKLLFCLLQGRFSSADHRFSHFTASQYVPALCSRPELLFMGLQAQTRDFSSSSFGCDFPREKWKKKKKGKTIKLRSRLCYHTLHGGYCWHECIKCPFQHVGSTLLTSAETQQHDTGWIEQRIGNSLHLETCFPSPSRELEDFWCA